MRVFPCLLLVAAGLLSGLASGQAILASVPTTDGNDVAIDAARNRVYVAGGYSNAVHVIDGASNTVASVTVGRRPQFIAVNAATNRIYSSNTQDGTLSVIDGATRAVVNLPVGGAGPIAINERTNRIYVMRRGNNGEVTVVDGATNTWYSIDTGSYVPEWQVLNPDTNKLYVSHSVSGDVRAIDVSSSSDHPPNVGIQVSGRPNQIALNAATNKVYVLSDDRDFPIVEIDGATNTATRIATPGHRGLPHAVAVNPVTNRIYAAIGEEIVVVEGATRAVSYIPTGLVVNLVVDPGLDRIYANKATIALLSIDGATRTFTSIGIPDQLFALGVNPVTHRVYTVGGFTKVVDPGAVAPPPPVVTAASVNAQGMWWGANGAESGWGIDIAQQGDLVFAAWFTYDETGNAQWFVMPRGERTSGDEYMGTLYRVSGPAFTAAFDPARVSSTAVGSMVLRFSDANTGTLDAIVGNARIVKPITRQVFASPAPTCASGGLGGAVANYTDIWWKSPAGSESGWGVFLTHQGDDLFTVWFTFDPDGRAAWFVGSNVMKTGNATYSGPLYRTAGTPYASPWERSRFAVTPVGSVSLAFTDAANGTFSYSVNGVTGSKPITRQVFSSPATVCR